MYDALILGQAVLVIHPNAPPAIIYERDGAWVTELVYYADVEAMKENN